MTKVLVVGPAEHASLRLLQENWGDALRGEAEVVVAAYWERLAPHAATAEVLVNAALGDSTALARRLWPQAPRLRWIHTLASGVDQLLTPELAASPILVTNARGVFSRPLAEFAALGMLYFSKRARRLVESQRARRWDGDLVVRGLAGQTLGIFGYGAIGRECARLARGFGMRVLATRRRAGGEADALVERFYPAAQFDPMLPLLDVLLVAAPLTAETFHRIGGRELALLPDGAIVINVGRGPVVDEAALIAALEAGRLAGAALDVFEREPLGPEHPFWAMENVLVSPHCTDREGDDWLEASVRCFLENFRRYQAGVPLENVVDKSAGY